MPLTTSPIDGAPMRQIHRYGIEFDVCPTTGGVWLDKGELDKLIMLVREETLSEQSPQRRRGRHHDNDDYDDEDHRQNRHSGGRRSRLADLFDF
jgi:Zn-finger nucleic acid-binding protein